MVIGIDVATDRLNCVALETDRSFAGGRVYAADDLGRLTKWAAEAEVIAIDAPAELSTAPHIADDSLSPKFRAARCAEIALGRDHGIWVPWTSPASPPIPGWIATGLEVYSALATSVPGFRVLTRPARLAKKTSVAGIQQRVDALATAEVHIEHLELGSHDSVDAALAALIAFERRNGAAAAATCGHDDSAIWLPMRPP